jgi:hypothetical protein
VQIWEEGGCCPHLKTADTAWRQLSSSHSPLRC